MDIWDYITGNLNKQQQEKESQADEQLIGLEKLKYDPESVADLFASEDPQLKNVQMKALSELQNIYEQGGMTAQDKQMLDEINRQTAQQERGQREAIQQNMMQRGRYGGGGELGNKLLAEQQGAISRNMGGTNVLANAQQRALNSLQQYGGMAGNIRGQELDKMQSRNLINQFNATNRNQGQQYNINKQYDLAMTRQNNLLNQAKNLQDRQNNARNDLGNIFKTGTKIATSIGTGNPLLMLG